MVCAPCCVGFGPGPSGGLLLPGPGPERRRWASPYADGRCVRPPNGPGPCGGRLRGRGRGHEAKSNFYPLAAPFRGLLPGRHRDPRPSDGDPSPRNVASLGRVRPSAVRAARELGLPLAGNGGAACALGPGRRGAKGSGEGRGAGLGREGERAPRSTCRVPGGGGRSESPGRDPGERPRRPRPHPGCCPRAPRGAARRSPAPSARIPWRGWAKHRPAPSRSGPLAPGSIGQSAELSFIASRLCFADFGDSDCSSPPPSRFLQRENPPGHRDLRNCILCECC